MNATINFFSLLILSYFLLIGSRGFANEPIRSGGESSLKAKDTTIEESFTPIDSSPDSSRFESITLEGRGENDWEKILPPVSATFYKLKDSSAVASVALITWGDLASFFTSLNTEGKEEAQDFLKKIHEEIAPHFLIREDGSYVAFEQEANQIAECTLSSGILSKYAVWREGHYQVYKTLCAPKENNQVDTALLEKQIKEELGAADSSTMDPSAMAYRLATERELTDWLAEQDEVVEVPLEEKIYGLLVINTENMQRSNASERRCESSLLNTTSLNQDPSTSPNQNDSKDGLLKEATVAEKVGLIVICTGISFMGAGIFIEGVFGAACFTALAHGLMGLGMGTALMGLATYITSRVIIIITT